MAGKPNTIYIEPELVAQVRAKYGNFSQFVRDRCNEYLGLTSISSLRETLRKVQEELDNLELQKTFLLEQLKALECKTPIMDNLFRYFRQRRAQGKVLKFHEENWCSGRLRDAQIERPDIRTPTELWELLDHMCQSTPVQTRVERFAPEILNRARPGAGDLDPEPKKNIQRKTTKKVRRRRKKENS